MRTLLYGGRVIDPANGVDDRLNILMRDGRIFGLGPDMMEADEQIDVSGRIVCPGFIDCHVHEDPLDEPDHIYSDPELSVFSCMLRMGVTTVVGGNCGENVCDPAKYLYLADRQGTAVNVAMLAGHSFFRSFVGARDPYGPATGEQLRLMTAELERCLDCGCAGISYGIRYTPGMDRDELMQTARAALLSEKPLACHLRDDAANVFGALEEFLSVADELELPAQVSHIGSMAGFGQMERFLAVISQRRVIGGMDVMCDCYPYSAFSTGLGSATYDDGWLERYGCDYGVLELCEGEYKGQRCTEEIFRGVRRQFPACRTVCHVMQPAEVALAVAHPSVMIASDATMNEGQGHPRAAGTFPRVFAQYVRTGKLSLYDAVAKMTAMPAKRFRLPGKGSLSFAADADVTVFDPEKICDLATFDDPTAAPLGVDYVFIGGQMAVERGKVVSDDLGRAVRV